MIHLVWLKQLLQFGMIYEQSLHYFFDPSTVVFNTKFVDSQVIHWVWVEHVLQFGINYEQSLHSLFDPSIVVYMAKFVDSQLVHLVWFEQVAQFVKKVVHSTHLIENPSVLLSIKYPGEHKEHDEFTQVKQFEIIVQYIQIMFPLFMKLRA